MDETTFLGQIGATLLYALLGAIVFAVTVVVAESMTKFSIKKQVVEDGNIAVAIVLASAILSLGLIVASAIH